METIFGGSILIFIIIGIILPITLFIGMIVICTKLSEINKNIIETKQNQEAILKMLIMIKNKKD